MDEDDIQLILKQYNWKSVTYEFLPGICPIKDFAEAVYTMRDHEGFLQFEYDDFTVKIKLILTRFGGIFGTLRFDELSFLNTLLSFTPYWVYEPTIAIYSDTPSVYTSDKILSLSTIDKTHLKHDFLDGSILDGVRQPIF